MAKPFNDLLRDQRGGMLHGHLSDVLAELVQAVVETGKGGEITLSLKISPNGENSVRITDAVKVKLPEKSNGFAIFFVDAGGNLLRENPTQHKMTFREAEPAASAPIREPASTQPSHVREAVANG